MSQDETAVNETVDTQATPAESAPAETTELEVVREGADLNPNDYRETEETVEEEEAPAESEPEKPQEPQDGEKPLSPKSENRFQQLANERNQYKAELEALRAREAQIAQEQNLLGEVNPETGDYYTPQEIERIAFQQSREQQQQALAEQRYNLEVQGNQVAMSSEAQAVVTDFPIFNPESPDFKPEIAAQAATLLEQNLIRDPYTPEIGPNGQPTGKGMIIGSNLSPYQLYKTIATAYEASAVPNRIEGQRATEKMLAQADTPTSARPSKTSAADEKSMSPEEYAKAHGMKPVW